MSGMEHSTLTMDHSDGGGHHENPLWLVVLCDMMTNLLLFFLILYSTTLASSSERKLLIESIQRSFEGETLAKDDEAARRENLIRKALELESLEKLRHLITREDFLKLAEFEMNEYAIRVRLKEDWLFNSGHAELTADAIRSLGPIGELVQLVPNDIVVEGHTDAFAPRGDAYKTNWQLSIARSKAVIDHLSSRYRVAPSRFVLAGYGEHHPAADNATPEGRLKNRRIEFTIQRPHGL